MTARRLAPTNQQLVRGLRSQARSQALTDVRMKLRDPSQLGSSATDLCCCHELVISHPDRLTGATSPPWQSTSKSRKLVQVTVLCEVVDTADVTIVGTRNYLDQVVAVTLPAGDNVVHVYEASMTNNTFAARGQFLTFAVTDIGDNIASNVTIICVFDCSTAGGDPPDPDGGGE